MSGKPRIPEAEYATIRSRYEAGESSLSIANTYSIDRGAIHLILRKKLGMVLTQPGGSPPTDPADVERIKQEYVDGKGATSIAKAFGVDKATVYNILARACIGTRPRSNRKGTTYHITKARLAAVTPTGKPRGSGACPGKKALNDHAFDVLTDDAAYWTGMLMADGNINDRNAFGQAGVSLGLQWGDRAHIEKFKLFTGAAHDIRKSRKKAGFIKGVPVRERFSANIGFVSDHMARKLSEYGVVPRKSAAAVASDDLAANPHFWRGCLDGDGSIYSTESWVPYGCAYLSGSEHLVRQFATYVSDVLRLKLGLWEEKPGCFVQWVDLSAGTPFMEAIYGPSVLANRLDRKYTVALEWFIPK